ncbi:MAG: DUF6049 family protein [Kineosporiaceae bacterium]
MSPTARRARSGTVLALLAAVATALLGPSAPPAAAAVRAAPATPAQLLIDTMAPAAMTPADTLRIEGRVVNTGTRPLTDIRVDLLTQYPVLDTRSKIASWTATPTTPIPSARRGGTALAAPIPSGGSARFLITIPARDLGLPATTSSFGAHGAAVEVFAGPDRGLVAVQRTYLVWSPDVGFAPTRLTLLAPLTSDLPVTDPADPTEEQLAEFADGGRLDNLIRATADPAFTWLLDPALLTAADAAASANVREPGKTGSVPPTTGPVTEASVNPSASAAAGDTGTGAAGTGAAVAATPTTPADTPSTGSGADTPTTSPDDSTTPTPTTTGDQPTATGDQLTATGDQLTVTAEQQAAAARWLDTVKTGLIGRDAAALPFGDTDLSAVAHGDATDLLRLSWTLSVAATRAVFGHALRTDLAFPVSGAADPTTLQMLAAAGARSVVLADGAQPTRTDLTYTPSGRTTVPVAGATALRGLLYDQTLSAELAATGGPSGALATQQFLADLATLTAEHPNDPRNILVTTPRGWDPDPAGVRAAARALRSATWLTPTPLHSLESAAVPAVDRVAPSYPAALQRAELPGATVTSVVDALGGLDRFTPALTAPEELVPGVQRTAVSLVGLPWRAGDAERDAALAALDGRVQALYDGIVVLPGGPKLLVSRSTSPLLVTLENRLDQPVHVVLLLKPRNGRLHVPHSVGVVLDPHRRQTVRVRIQAVANGDVEVATSLLTPEGIALKGADPIMVRVHSDWESRALGITGTLLGLLVLVGLIRGIRRGRTRMPPDSVPDADEEVVRRETRTPDAPASPPSAEPPATESPEPPGTPGSGPRTGDPDPEPPDRPAAEHPSRSTS